MQRAGAGWGEGAWGSIFHELIFYVYRPAYGWPFHGLLVVLCAVEIGIPGAQEVINGEVTRSTRSDNM